MNVNKSLLSRLIINCHQLLREFNDGVQYKKKFTSFHALFLSH